MSAQKTKNDWMQTKWRPMMGWTYMATCITDFILFPILWSVLQAVQGGQVTSQWIPITLQGAGLFHVAMGAVVGVAAWSRGQEKMRGATGFNDYRPYMDDYDSRSDWTPRDRYPINTGRTYTSRRGHLGPVIEEPLL